MKDLTQGSVVRHLVHMASFMAVSMLMQTLYLLADLYFVGRLGREAIAAVGVAGNLTMIVMALTQMLSVGTTALLAHAAGRKDQAQAERIFNQSFAMSLLISGAFAAIAFLLRDTYAHALSADAATAELAKSYLNWFIPALALQFAMVTLGAALRATGVIKPAVGFQVLSVALNIVFAPLLIFCLGPIPALGVSGAALATFVAIVIANVGLVIYFNRRYHYVRFRPAEWQPQLRTWWAMLKVGLPAGAEFALLTVYALLVYAIIRPFGAAAQAGFGIGLRVMQALFLPVVALSFAVGPVVGQNFGGRHADRVRQTVWAALGLASAVMLVLTIVAWLEGPALIRPFSSDPDVIAFGGEYLTIVSLNFLASGIAFSSSSVFQGIGNTIPPLLSTASRLVLFALPALWLARTPGFHIRQVWYLSVASQLVQAVLVLLLLRRELARKLKFDAVAAT
jgi:putative MATE family efflux protein